jgi:hypothetical protein
MDQTKFEQGHDVDTYVRNIRNYRSLVRRLAEKAEANDDHARALEQRAASYEQPVRATIMTEDWCGDSALNTPVLASLFEKAGIELRVFRGSEHEDLKDKYESDGDDHIPVISLWDGTGAEIGRWIEAPRAVEEKKNEWKAARPEFMDLYEKQKTDKDAAKRFATLYREFLEEMAGWYEGGMWDETTREVADLLKDS